MRRFYRPGAARPALGLFFTLAVLGALPVVASSSEAATATPTFVHGTARVIRSGTANNVAFSATAGNLVVVYVTWDNPGAATVADTNGNRFAVAAPQLAWGSGKSAEVFYAANVSGGATTITATFASSITRFGQVFVNEYAGVDATRPLDTTAAATGAGPAMSSGVARTKAPDLVVGAGSSDKTVTAASPWYTWRSHAFDNIVEDKRLLRAGTPVATATQNGSAWVMQLVAFRAATVTTTTTTPIPTTPMPGMGQPDHCMFTSFCDAFQTIKAGGRAGDLDETKWSAARVTQFNNPAQGDINKYVPFTPEFCMDHNAPPRLADNDSFICGQQFGESNHWMEGMNDAGQYVVSSFRPVQPFDFAGRTSTLDFSVDAKTAGPHSAWIEAWLTADPQQAPHEDFPGTHTFPRQGVEFRFDADWCGALTGNALRQVAEYNGYVLTADHSSQTPCFTTADDTANHFQLRVSQNRIEVWVSDAGGANFKFRYGVDVNLPFTRGYWNLQHVQYNADKFGSGMQTTTYHWHAVSFDGPVLPADGSYQVPDALSKTPLGNMNLGYQTPTVPFTLTGVDPTGTAYLTFNVYWFQSPATLNLNVNGHTVQAADPTPDLAAHRYQWHFLTVPVPAADLVAGSNTVQISNNGCGDQCPTVANVDLEVVRR